MRLFFAAVLFATAFLAVPADAQSLIPVPGRAAAPATTDKENLWLLDLSNGGRVTIWLRPDVAPKMVERIKTLTRRKFYDGLLFHRVIEGFMAQGGDPKGDGTGGSDLGDLPAEFNYLPHVRGAVSAAREGAPEGADAAVKKKAEDSANSQFFIVFTPRLSLDKKYTVFGRVIDGMQYVDTIERGEPPANPTRIVHAYIAADNPPAYVAPTPERVMVDPVSLPPGPGRRVPPAR
ncbi:peptidylprolyl isomerase [Sphingomonas guangdongensis]|uniref:Peptidyl-prolyl cis-trans isomerase n=1 Tax=Sphingomonas guangdongensis TaxID=1141890 RepID=A0A285R342_9SPHN|nr:peptidylprolyl isomerase [Sphingomonas guangdongensis]SOB88178.1 peptidylprolyl isomerase [Sphingomonas guangdongensis]